jgi:beta-xylosidase
MNIRKIILSTLLLCTLFLAACESKTTPLPEEEATLPPVETSLPPAEDTPIPPTVTTGVLSIFRDEFINSLAPHWTWTGENPDKWNLSEMPGSLRIYTAPYGDAGGQNLLLRPAQSANFTISTHFRFEPVADFQLAGLVIYQSDATRMVFGRAFCAGCVGNGLYFDYFQDGTWMDTNYATSVDSLNEAWLKLERQGNEVTALYSADGLDWMEIGTHTTPDGFVITGVGLTCSQDLDKSDADIPADFDYFEMEMLP